MLNAPHSPALTLCQFLLLESSKVCASLPDVVTMAADDPRSILQHSAVLMQHTSDNGHILDMTEFHEN